MIPALTIDEIRKSCRNRYAYDERRIIAIMIARYSDENSQNMIRRHYSFWHYMSGKALDIFWLGYGAYHFPGKPGQIRVGNIDDEPEVFFDTRIFVDGIKQLEYVSKLSYNDSIGILLCNYHNGSIHLDESVYFSIEKLVEDSQQRKLKDFSSMLIRECSSSSDVVSVTHKLRAKLAFYAMLEIKASALVEKVLSNIGKSLIGL
jgi:hypothetical protein